MRIRGIGVVAAAAVALFIAGVTPQAQSTGQLAYPLILTPQRALALIQAAEQKLDYIPGEVVVRFKTGIGSLGQQRALMALRSRPSTEQIKWIDERTGVIADGVEWNADILAAQLSTQPEVQFAEPNYIAKFNTVPNDPSYSARQWNLAALQMDRAWDISPGASSDVLVAVVDSGLTVVRQTYSFPTWNGRATVNTSVPVGVNPDLDQSRVAFARDFAFWSGPVIDMGGHGTHVASTITEDANNALAEAGIAYRAKVLPVKACVSFWEIQFAMSASGIPGYSRVDAGGCPTSAIAQGIRYAADSGARVINLSLGSAQPSQLLLDALHYAVGKGAFISISAGNSFLTGNPVDYPAGYASGIDGVMAVGAVGRSLNRSYYSSTGSHVEIAAPGGSDRDGGSSGLIWQMTLFPPDSDAATVIFPRFDRYAEVGDQGTSMASPHVAATAALLVSRGISDPAIIEALIKATARDLGRAGRDDEYGYGLIQPRAALFGFGIAR